MSSESEVRRVQGCKYAEEQKRGEGDVWSVWLFMTCCMCKVVLSPILYEHLLHVVYKIKCVYKLEGDMCGVFQGSPRLPVVHRVVHVYGPAVRHRIQQFLSAQLRAAVGRQVQPEEAGVCARHGAVGGRVFQPLQCELAVKVFSLQGELGTPPHKAQKVCALRVCEAPQGCPEVGHLGGVLRQGAAVLRAALQQRQVELLTAAAQSLHW